IIGLKPTGDEEHASLIHRLSLNGTVVFCTDDLHVPADLAVRDSVTIRSLVHMILNPPAGYPLTARQRTFLDRHTTTLATTVTEAGGMLPAECRIETRYPDGRLVTGVVLGSVANPDGTVSSYAWLPDRATLPGGAAAGLRLSVVSPASDVRASLLPFD